MDAPDEIISTFTFILAIELKTLDAIPGVSPRPKPTMPISAISRSHSISSTICGLRVFNVDEIDFNGAARYITAKIDQRTCSTSNRFNYNINPNLSIQFYGHPFFSRGTYSDFNFVNNAADQDLGERLTLFNTSKIS